MEKPQIRAVSAPWNAAVHLLVRQGNTYGQNISMVEIPEGRQLDPTIVIDMQDAQLLMDDLWHAGLRPTEGSGSAGSLKATERHLEDLKTVLFHNLGIGKT